MQGFALGDRIIQTIDTHPSWCAAYADIGSYRVIGASAVGKGHRLDGRPRDDAFAVRCGEQFLAVAVSDGVGSCPDSRYGAAYAVEALSENLLRAALGTKSELSIAQSKPKDNPPAPSNARASRPAFTLGLSDEEKDTLPLEERAATAPPLRDDKPRRFNSFQDILPRSGARWFEEASEREAFLSFPPAPQNPDGFPGYGTLTWKLSPEVAARTAADFPVEEALRKAFGDTQEMYRQYTRSLGGETVNYACTLLGMLIDCTTGEMAVGHLGDGLILGYDRKARMVTQLVSPILPEEYGHVYTLAHEGVMADLPLRTWSAEKTRPFSAFMLMTDGVSEDFASGPDAGVQHNWARDIERETRTDLISSQAANRLLYWLATYDRPGSLDDRTLLIIQRQSENPEDRGVRF